MTIDEKIDVLQAYKNKRVVEYKYKALPDGRWYLMEDSNFDFINFDYREQVIIDTIDRHVYTYNGGEMLSKNKRKNDYNYLGLWRFQAVKRLS